MQKRNHKKEIIILRHNGGRLANQLLLYFSIYAFCLEKGYKCLNYSFYEYQKYFNFQNQNFFTKLFSIISNLRFYKSHAIIYKLYCFWTYFVPLFHKGEIIKEDPNDTFLLPPTPVKNKNHWQIINATETSNLNRFYIDGWMFRNPGGLKKYHDQIVKTFKPKEEIIQRVDNFVNAFKSNKLLVGIHIRQGDYKSKSFMGGTLYFNEKEVAEILKNYLKKENKNPKKVSFILCSDGPLNLSFFSGLNIKLGIGSIMEDIITLSMCNLIIGSDSTFGAFAAYLGNIPFLVFDRKKKWVRAKRNDLFQY